MFSYPPRTAEPTELVGDFTPEEAARITLLRRQYCLYPDRFKLDINYWRLDFARWLVVHGYLDEWCGSQSVQNDQALSVRAEKYPARCA